MEQNKMGVGFSFGRKMSNTEVMVKEVLLMFFIVHWDLMHQTLVMKILSIRSIKKGVMLANILEKVQLKFKTI